MKTDKHYVSAIDKKLAEFNETLKPTASQQAEIEKYRRIHSLRDDAESQYEKDGESLFE